MQRRHARWIGAAIAALAAVALAVVWLAAGAGHAPGPLGPPCDPGAERPQIEARLRASLFAGAGVSEEHVRAALGAAAAYYAEHGLSVRADEEIVRLPDRYLFSDASGDGPALAAPLRAFVAEHATAPDGGIRIVVLEAIAPPGSPVAGALPRLHGLTLSPALEARGFELAPVLGEEHAPVVLLRATGDARADARTLAHELGHALGLEHRHAPGNLMLQREAACEPWIDRQQARVMREALARELR